MYQPIARQYGSFTVNSNQFWINEVRNLSKFKRGTLATKSLSTQRWCLEQTHKHIQAGDTQRARIWLDNWKNARAYHAHLIGMFDHVSL